MKFLSRRQLIRNWLLGLVFGFGLHSVAFAACSTPDLPKALPINAMQVPSNLKTGDVIPGSVQPFTIAGTCTSDNNNRDIVACVYTPLTEPLPGVYATTVKGIGMRVRDSNGTPLVNAVGAQCQQKIGRVTNGAFNFSGTWELVRLDGVVPANASLSSADGKWAFGVYQAATTLNDPYNQGSDRSIIYPAGSISLVNLTCSATWPSAVTLPDAKSSDMPSVGSTTGAAPFSIGTKCNLNTSVGITLDAAPGYSVLDARQGVMSITTGSGKAKGIALQISDGSNDTVVPLGERIDKARSMPTIRSITNSRSATAAPTPLPVARWKAQ